MGAQEKRRAWLLALGREDMPDTFVVRGRVHRLEQVYKHDFFAATGRYVDARGVRVILKLGRRSSLLGLPMKWLGRLVTWNEARALHGLSDLDFVPRLVARPGPRALVRSFVAGRTLHKGDVLPEAFFADLRACLSRLHERGWAYVDLEKPENVIAGEDGRPYLCDFQISWKWPRRFGGELWPSTWWRGALQRADRYHVLKLERRIRPERMSPADLARSKERPLNVRVHRGITRPLQAVRRAILKRLDPTLVHGERGRVSDSRS